MPHPERGGRRYGLDALRALSMLMVVAVHSLEVLDYTWRWGMVVNAIGLALFFPANAFFFMLSGKLNLRVINQVQIPRFYLRKIRNILIPTLVYFFINTLFDLWPSFGSVLHVGKVFVLNALGQYRHIHYWFVYQLFGFFLATPFLARTFEGLHRRRTELVAFIALGLLFTTAAYLMPNTGVELNWHYPFSMFLFAYCVGPSLAPNEAISARARRWCGVGMGVCGVAMVALMLVGWGTGLHDVSPFYTVFSMCAFMLVVDACSRMKPLRVVDVLAGNSFGVYLCHMMVMDVVERFVPVYFVGKMSLVGVFVTWLLTVAGSLVVTIVVNAVLVNPLELLFDRVIHALGWGGRPRRRRGDDAGREEPADEGEFDLSDEFEPEADRRHLVLYVRENDAEAQGVRDFAEGHAINVHVHAAGESAESPRLATPDGTIEGAEEIVAWLRDNLVDA